MMVETFQLSPGINMCKNCFWGQKSFQEGERNEKFVTDILKLEELFGIFLLLYLSPS